MSRFLCAATLGLLLSVPGSVQSQQVVDGRASRVLTIGGNELDPESLWFDFLVGLRVFPGGSVAVVSRKTHNIRVFGPGGRLVRTFARKGQGPGELSDPGGLSLAGDRLWLSAGIGRVAVFDTSGRHIRTFVPDVDSVRNPQIGMRHQWVLTKRMPQPATVRTPINQLKAHFVLRRARAKPDTIASVALGLHVELGNAIVGTVSQTFFPTGDVSVIGDSVVVVADGMTGEIRWIRLDRDSARVVRREILPFPRRPVTSTDLADAVRLMQTSGRGVATGDAPTGGLHRMFRPIDPPPVWSVARKLLASADGYIWIHAADAPNGDRVWVLYPPEGAPIRFALPRRFVGRDVLGRRIYGDERVGSDVVTALTVYEVGR
jgi:hypothetical protein